jgi:hypothetical protein
MVVEALDIAQKIKRRRRGLALLAKPDEMGLDCFALAAAELGLLLRKDPRGALVAGREHRRRGAQVCANSLESLLDLPIVLQRRLDAPLQPLGNKARKVEFDDVAGALRRARRPYGPEADWALELVPPPEAKPKAPSSDA